MAEQKRDRRGDRSQAGRLRRWLAYLVPASAVLLLAGLGGGAYHYLSQPGRMPLRVVEVKGEFRHLSQAEISATAGEVIDGGFFTCDMAKLRGAILTMAWVDDVAIRRVWPDRLVMHVVERKPLARWGDDALISEDAEVFRPGNVAQYAELADIHGPEGNEQRVVDFYRVVTSLARQRDLAVRVVRLDERRHWWVDFDGGLTLSLGREDRDSRLGEFLRVYPQLIADPQRRPERVDMRYEHGFAVRWRAGEGDETAMQDKKAQEKV